MTQHSLRHLSIRVPWHDAGWAGVVCNAPQLNGACAKLKRIAGSKKDLLEVAIAGRRLDDIPADQWPCCVDERATFMAPFELEQVKRHALAATNSKFYGHFQPTPQRYPAYSAGIVPFSWMMKANLDGLSDRLELAVDAAREPDLGYETNWVHEAQNQTELLNGFAAHLKKEESLCLFYAKHVPFSEGTGRILVGAGRIKEVGPLTEYNRSGEGMRGMLWERPIQHSIRPKGQDGFLMPYIELLRLTETDPSIDHSIYTAHAPTEHWDEFSFGSELVTHDGAIAALLSMDVALGQMEKDLGIATGWQRQWIHDELVRLWKVRGPFPGLGAVLRSFGMSRGVFVAHALQLKAGNNADPWPLVDEAFQDPAKSLPTELCRDLKELAPTWKGLSTQRRALLRLLSRFELSVEQAQHLYDEGSRRKQGWIAADVDILRNPYRIYECSRNDLDGVQLMTVDRGVFPEDIVRLIHPLEEPSRLESAIDARRVRAFAIHSLEKAAAEGHTLHFSDGLAQGIKTTAVRPECPVSTDILRGGLSSMEPEIVSIDADGKLLLQLERYRTIGALVRKQILGRVGGKRHKIPENWSSLLTKKFGTHADADEQRARQEKVFALAELAESRFSVLAGPAGAGKTTVLGILCTQREIQAAGILLLAPTGKARVRMQQLATSAGTRAQTIAQFLNQNSRYDGHNGRYHLSESPKASGFGTVIIDEASMLTEDMLGAVLDALQGVQRLILVGDPAQLPPIGAGRPFVDIITQLRPPDYEAHFPRVAPGYAELTIERRQIGTERADLRLARWFSTTTPSAGEDDIFCPDGGNHSTIRFVGWQTPEEFQRKLLEVVAEELGLASIDDLRGFNRAVGSAATGEYDYFNATRNGKVGAVAAVEAWQILSPLRGMPFGVGDINRQLHERFRAGFMQLASRQRRSIPKPMGAERIVYGDKVMNLSNHRRDGRKVYPQEGALGYLANGETGIVVGQWKSNGYPKILKVEFSSQPGYTYDFYASDFREEGDVALELAYALTVHKAQGSQFELTIVVLPQAHPIISRELIYTALTRHQNRVVVMHQGQLATLKGFTSPHHSETARRRTNLLAECQMLEFPLAKGSVFMQAGLIHRTSKGLAVRSKSELLLAEAFISANIAFEYEKPLMLGGSTRYPDFTIEDEISGRTVYWEHLGMLDRDDYRMSWEKKLAWYRRNGIHPANEANPGDKLLVMTTDSAASGLDMAQVRKTIAQTIGS